MSVQQINTSESSYNTEKFITVKKNDKNKKKQTEPSTGLQNPSKKLKLFRLKYARTNLNILMRTTQSAITYLKLTIEIVEQGVKYVQS